MHEIPILVLALQEVIDSSKDGLERQIFHVLEQLLFEEDHKHKHGINDLE